MPAAISLAFFIGAMLARLLLQPWHKPAIAVLLEAAMIAGLGFLPIGIETAVLILAPAMGMQAAAITHFSGAAVSTVVVTSTLARTAETTLDRMWPTEKRVLPAVTTPRLLALTWIGHLLGAVAGALLLHVMPYPLIVPAALLVLVVLL